MRTEKLTIAEKIVAIQKIIVFMLSHPLWRCPTILSAAVDSHSSSGTLPVSGLASNHLERDASIQQIISRTTSHD